MTTAAPRPHIEARALTKRYDDYTAVDAVSFEVQPGEYLGLLGPNGAGKTTTIRMITCFSPPTGGELRVLGHDVLRDPRSVKAGLGLVPQDENLDPDLPVAKNLEVYGRYHGLDAPTRRARAAEQLAFFQLEDKAAVPVHELSGGMKRRLMIARALVAEPTILVLDEPTVGLDPQARHLVWQKLRQLRNRGVTMLLTTHYMDEAAHLCDRIIVMHQGGILAEGTPTELIAEHAGEAVLELRLPATEVEALLAPFEAGPGGVDVEEVEGLFYVFGAGPAAHEVATRLGDPSRAFVRPGNLEDVFLRLTGRGLLE
ncbi:MAG: ABC transporter ATP-binding protein [Dehalococcoidia bacterium]